MRPIRTILVPIDLEAGAELVIDHALGLAAPLGARVVLVYVYPTAVTTYPVALMPSAAELEREARCALQRMVDVASERGLTPVIGRVRPGDAPNEILAEAESLDADLIVMGTHGRRGLDHVLLGSVAEKVVRLSPVPVMTVRTGQSRAA